MGFKRRSRVWLWTGALGLALTATRLSAHTLPISYLFVVADTDYVHLELSFNPFELAGFAELDTNRNSRLDRDELAGAERGLTARLLDHLKLRVNGTVVPVETAGLSPEADTHHATLRAHYKVDARHTTLAVESTLQAVTGSSHLTQVNFLRAGKRELAQLDARAGTATFAAPADTRCDPALPGMCVACRPVSEHSGSLWLALAFGVVLLLAFQRGRRLHTTPPTSSTRISTNPQPTIPTNP